MTYKVSFCLYFQASLALPDSKVRNLLMRQNSMDESEQMGHTFTSSEYGQKT